MNSNRYSIKIDYLNSFEGPAYFVARRVRGEPRLAVPNEDLITAEIEKAYVHGFILRERYDDPMKRITKLTFKRRPRTPYDYRPDDIHD